jgi:hypothetical protein
MIDWQGRIATAADHRKFAYLLGVCYLGFRGEHLWNGSIAPALKALGIL